MVCCVVLHRPAVRDCWEHLQPEPEAGESSMAVENLLGGSSAKDLTPQGPQQLQAGGTNIPPDEDPGKAGPCTPLPPGVPIIGPTTVRLPALHRGG